MKLYLGYDLKIANVPISCDLGKFAKNPAGILIFFSSYLRVFFQQLHAFHDKEWLFNPKLIFPFPFSTLLLHRNFFVFFTLFFIVAIFL